MDRAELQAWFDAARAWVQGFVNFQKARPPFGAADVGRYPDRPPGAARADHVDEHALTILGFVNECAGLCEAYGGEDTRHGGPYDVSEEQELPLDVSDAWRAAGVGLLERMDRYHATMRAAGALPDGSAAPETTDADA